MIKYSAALFFIFSIVLVFGFSEINIPPQYHQKKIDVGEEITYVVKYLAFEIGEEYEDFSFLYPKL